MVVGAMSEDCGHRCCHIRTNSYHVHASEPAVCARCTSALSPRIVALTDQLVHAGGRPHRQAPAPEAIDGARRTTSTATTSSWLRPVE
jgi:hypothetical protein